MKVVKNVITIKQLIEDYTDNGEEGVVGFGGKLNIRPAYQREFIYKPAQQTAVIESILAKMPLNTMYWGVNGDGTLEILDGQQRAMSICRFVTGKFAIDYHFFLDLSEEDKESILNYELDVYFCEGSERDKIKWFETINIAGERLTSQELRNAIFTGPWVTDAKRYFSKTNCPSSVLSEGLVKGNVSRQELLEIAISWISDGEIEKYMSVNRHKTDARELWDYFQSVINWVKRTFVTPHPRLMQSIHWGKLYNQYKDTTFNPIKIDQDINDLLVDDEVTNKKGVFEYILTGDEKHLSVRAFTIGMMVKKFTLQGGACARCGTVCDLKSMEADHITPWSEGGTTVEDNCQMLCKKCNRSKSDK